MWGFRMMGNIFCNCVHPSMPARKSKHQLQQYNKDCQLTSQGASRSQKIKPCKHHSWTMVAMITLPPTLDPLQTNDLLSAGLHVENGFHGLFRLPFGHPPRNVNQACQEIATRLHFCRGVFLQLLPISRFLDCGLWDLWIF